jgi:hypothetical protein
MSSQLVVKLVVKIEAAESSKHSALLSLAAATVLARHCVLKYSKVMSSLARCCRLIHTYVHTHIYTYIYHTHTSTHTHNIYIYIYIHQIFLNCSCKHTQSLSLSLSLSLSQPLRRDLLTVCSTAFRMLFYMLFNTQNAVKLVTKSKVPCLIHLLSPVFFGSEKRDTRRSNTELHFYSDLCAQTFFFCAALKHKSCTFIVSSVRKKKHFYSDLCAQKKKLFKRCI